MERRVLLFFILSFLVIFGTTELNRRLNPPPKVPPAPQQPAAGPAPATSSTMAAAPAATPAAPAPAPAPAAPTANRAEATTVSFRNDAIAEVVFSTRGAVPVRWDITAEAYVAPPVGESRKSMKKKGIQRVEPLIDPELNKFSMLPRPFETVLQESGAGAFYNNFNNDVYQAEKVTSGSLTGYRFTSPPSQTGLRMVKTYLFKEGQFTGQLKIELINEGKYNLTFDRGGGAGLGVILGPGLGHFGEDVSRYEGVEPAILGPEGMFYDKSTTPGKVIPYPGSQISWGGIQSLYFLAALIPTQPAGFVSAQSVLNPNIGTMIPNSKLWAYYSNVELYGPSFTMGPGQRQSFSYDFFVGPKQRKILTAADHELNRALFFRSWNWMRALAVGLMKLLIVIQNFVVNWGVAIIILTIIVRLLTFPLVQKGMKSQAKMMAEQQRLKPLMDKINEKYKADPQRKQQEIFKLYKEHGVNPFGAFKGCIWMMIQMPILVALYYVISQSIDLRGAEFLWIKDLSAPDRLFRFGASLPLIGRDFNILPIIMAATQILTSKLSTTTSAAADPQQEAMQKNMMYMMPIMMLFIFYGMPSGLVLYWTVSNIWQIGQQAWVNKHTKKPGAPVNPPGAPLPKKA